MSHIDHRACSTILLPQSVLRCRTGEVRKLLFSEAALTISESGALYLALCSLLTGRSVADARKVILLIGCVRRLVAAVHAEVSHAEALHTGKACTGIFDLGASGGFSVNKCILRASFSALLAAGRMKQRLLCPCVTTSQP